MYTYLDIAKLEGEMLVLDFSKVKFLNTFDICELFFHIITSFGFNDFKIDEKESPSVGYLERINFFYQIDMILNINKRKQSTYTGDQERLLELRTFPYKDQFGAMAV